MAKFEWKTGEPNKIGFYITTRERNLGGKTVRYVAQDYYATDELSKKESQFGQPLPNCMRQGWQVGVADASKIIAWCNIEDIEPF